MDLCTKHNFDPERSIILRNVEPTVRLEDVQKAFTCEDKVTKIKWLENDFSGSLLCEFEQGLTAMLLDDEHPNADKTRRWKVIQIEEMDACSENLDPSKPKDPALLENIIEDMTENFKEQITGLAQLHKVSTSDLFQKALCQLSSVAEVPSKQLSVSTPCPKISFTLDTSVTACKGRSSDCGAEASQLNSYHSHDGVSPNEVKRVIIEHIVKPDKELMECNHYQHKIHVFSGNIPKPSNEVDYASWRLQAKQVLKDACLPEHQKCRQILESLLPPALNIALCAGESAASRMYFRQLENAYGCVTKGEELYIEFLETHQNRGEKPSEFLCRLHTLMQEVVEKKGLAGRQANSLLVKQFVRGCWDEMLITRLQLSEILANATMPYSDLLFKVRTFEHERQLKENRKKRYFRMSPSKPHSRRVVTFEAHCGPHKVSSSYYRNMNLEDRIKQLEQDVAKVRALQGPLNTGDARKEMLKENPKSYNGDEMAESKTELIFQGDSSRIQKLCYRCGDDMHLMQFCCNPENTALVQKKLAQRQKNKWKQQEIYCDSSYNIL